MFESWYMLDDVHDQVQVKETQDDPGQDPNLSLGPYDPGTWVGNGFRSSDLHQPPLSHSLHAPKSNRSPVRMSTNGTRKKDSQSLGHIVRSGIAGGVAGCVVCPKPAVLTFKRAHLSALLSAGKDSCCTVG